jgi:hypothetical protein
MPPKLGPSQIKTRPSNKGTHPGNVTKGTSRRTPAEMKLMREEKAKAKASREKAKQQGITRTAQFEHSDKLDEELGEATPRPLLASGLPRAPRNRKQTKPVSITSSSDVEKGNDSEASAPTEDVATESDSTAESDQPPPKKQTKATVKPTVKIGKPGTVKTAAKRKKLEVDTDANETTSSDKETTPQPKKVKVKMRDEINLASKEIGETEAKQQRRSDTVKSAASKPAPKVPGDGGSRKLKREGAMLQVCEDVNKATSANNSVGKGDRLVLTFSHFPHVSVANAR